MINTSCCVYLLYGTQCSLLLEYSLNNSSDLLFVIQHVHKTASSFSLLLYVKTELKFSHAVVEITFGQVTVKDVTNVKVLGSMSVAVNMSADVTSLTLASKTFRCSQPIPTLVFRKLSAKSCPLPQAFVCQALFPALMFSR